MAGHSEVFVNEIRKYAHPRSTAVRYLLDFIELPHLSPYPPRVEKKPENAAAAGGGGSSEAGGSGAGTTTRTTRLRARGELRKVDDG